MKAAKSIVSALTLLAFSFAFASCGGKDTHAKVMGDMIKAMNKMAGALEGVDDEASAKKAAKTIEGMEGAMNKLKERADALGEPDEALGKKLEEKFKPELEEAVGKMMKSTMGLASKPELMKILQPALDKVGGIMDM